MSEKALDVYVCDEKKESEKCMYEIVILPFKGHFKCKNHKAKKYEQWKWKHVQAIMKEHE